MDLQSPTAVDEPVRQQEGIRAKELVEGALLYVGIPAVTLYPLGFIALGLQLYRDPSFPYTDFITVWEAVALIPQTVVAATGVRLIYTSLVACVLGAAIASVTMTILRYGGRKKDGAGREEPERPPGSRRLWSALLLILVPLAVMSVLIESDGVLDNRPDNDYVYLIGFALFAIGGGFLMHHATNQRRREHWFAPGLVAAYAAAVVAALCLAAMETPGLSLVEVDVGEGGRGAETCAADVSGNTYVKLEEGLSHWHLYNEEGLFAIPHEDLRYVEYKRCTELLSRN